MPGKSGRTSGMPLAVALIAFSFSFPAVTAEPAPPGQDGMPVPSPGLGPQDVVRIQLDALRANDDADRGIAIAFRFASPRNKASTGPLPRFIEMIKGGPYRLMLDYESASFSPIRIEGGRAAQRVMLVGRLEVRSYVFILERQNGPPCDGCWMTEAVLVVAGPEQAV